MKAYLLLLLLLPLCSAKKFNIQCYGYDFASTDGMLQCSSDVKQACYTRNNGEKGCITLDYCSHDGWNCCYTDGCNQ